MVVECICIILIVLLMGFVFLRAHRKDYAVMTLPLLILPLLHLLMAKFAAEPLAGAFALDTGEVMVAADALALVISCTAFGFFSHRITAKRARIAYLLCCGTFVTILTWVFIIDVLS